MNLSTALGLSTLNPASKNAKGKTLQLKIPTSASANAL